MTRSTVWIDHQKAYIFDYLADGVHRREVNALHEGRMDKEHLRKFYHQVALELDKTSCLFLMGPGMAKEEFRNHCEGHHPKLAKGIVETRSMKDHPSFAEILKISNAFFAKYNDWVSLS